MAPAAQSNAAYDAIVIGGGVGGLVAAAYLGRSGARALLLEAGDGLGGRAETAVLADAFRVPHFAHVLYALDRRVVRDLRLERRGLAFAERDMKLVALRSGGGHIIVTRGGLRTPNGRSQLPGSDLAAYGRFRRSTLAFARRLRPLWRAEIEIEYEPAVSQPLTVTALMSRLRLSNAETDLLIQLERLSASAYLDRWFESDALKAALSFDAGANGLSPHEAGSALALVWRLAQDSCGVQGAVSQPKGGPGSLVTALADAGRYFGAELRTGVRVASIAVENGRAAGVVLANGQALSARIVISNLDARQTLLDLVPPGAIGFGTAASVPDIGRVASAKVTLALSGPPPVAGLEQRDLISRLIVAERPESAAEAKGAALAGELPAELVLEATIPTIADPGLAPAGCHVLSVLVPYMPVLPVRTWTASRELLAARVIGALEAYAPGLKDRIVATDVVTPDDVALRFGVSEGAATPPLDRLLSCYETRVRTLLPGLFLCSSTAEPASAISGRAGRVAAVLALEELANARQRWQ
jgi:phytoene dehydrogenase-like protein